ncbi:MAG: DUF2256 domain-containing protein [Armatimonadota bacterium]
MPQRNDSHLPTMVCLTRGRPFSWRKKWERNWSEVKSFSDRCRSAKPKCS